MKIIKSKNYNAIRLDLVTDNETQQILFNEIEEIIRKVRRKQKKEILYRLEKK